MTFEEYLKENKVEYGLPNSRQNLIDELVELSEFIHSNQKNIGDPNQIFTLAVETKFKQEMDSFNKRADDVKVQVIDILKEKFSKSNKIINNDKETSNKEKETKNERSKGKSKESTSGRE